MTAFKLIVSATLLRLALLFYGDWQDRHFDVKYTDIDYFVYSDAALYITQGLSPYERATYRYSPLVAWLLIPNSYLTPLWGKMVFCVFDLMAGCLMLWWPQRGESVVPMVLWLFNPFTFAISTRGSCDSVTVFGLLAILMSLQRGCYLMAGILWGICVHWRLFPVIYAPAILLYLLHTSMEKDHMASKKRARNVFGLLCAETVQFGVGALISLLSLGGVFWVMYSDGYIENALLYHLSRLDPRHNFSLHFYPIYLTHWSTDTEMHSLLMEWTNLDRVTSLFQITLFVAVALKYRQDLLLSFSLTTVIFVAFNKVCTAQYFVWYFGLLPLLISRYSLQKILPFGMSVFFWMLAQGHWLLWAYLLEFQGQALYLQVWFSSCLFLLAHVQLIRSILKLHSYPYL